MFRIIHRRDAMTPNGFQRALEKARTDVIHAGIWAPRCSPAKNLAKCFRVHGEAYFRFITTPGVEPTNNLAEQAICFVVIDRRITQGTRSVTVHGFKTLQNKGRSPIEPPRKPGNQRVAARKRGSWPVIEVSTP